MVNQEAAARRRIIGDEASRLMTAAIQRSNRYCLRSRYRFAESRRVESRCGQDGVWDRSIGATIPAQTQERENWKLECRDGWASICEGTRENVVENFDCCSTSSFFWRMRPKREGGLETGEAKEDALLQRYCRIALNRARTGCFLADLIAVCRNYRLEILWLRAGIKECLGRYREEHPRFRDGH